MEEISENSKAKIIKRVHQKIYVTQTIVKKFLPIKNNRIKIEIILTIKEI